MEVRKRKSSQFNLKERNVRLDIRNTFLTTRVMNRWNRAPRKAVDSPPLEAVKNRADEHVWDILAKPDPASVQRNG